MSNLIEEVYFNLTTFVQTYGWYFVFAALAIYISQPYLNKLHQERVLATANEPRRKAALDAQRLRVRLAQQRLVNEKPLAEEQVEEGKSIYR
mmetsp:Transcript_30117/g.50371  ORF Transcript_30117/g.50371 Transcript_30117/m.50371 type:complete len:92 (+) Transcript_30117:83-358(+)